MGIRSLVQEVFVGVTVEVSRRGLIKGPRDGVFSALNRQSPKRVQFCVR